MLRDRIFMMLFVAFVVGGSLMGYFRQKPELVRHTLSEAGPEPRRQVVEERQWQEVRFEALASVSGVEEPLSNVLVAQRDRQGNLFVLDWGDSTIKKFSPDGQLLQRYSWILAEGKNVRPAPIDFAVGDSGEVWVAYTDPQRVKIFGPGGEARALLELEESPHRIALGCGGDFVVLALDYGLHLFQSYGADGRLLRQFGQILAGGVQEPLVLDGMIAADGDGSFVYAPHYIGLLASYTMQGEPRFLVQTVGAGSGSVPRVMIHPGGMRKLEPGSPWRSLVVRVEMGRIYVMSERESKASKQRILDVYSNDDGTYLHSIRLPDGPRNFLIDGDLLYTIHAKEIRRWRMIPDSTVRPGVPAAEGREAVR